MLNNEPTFILVYLYTYPFLQSKRVCVTIGKIDLQKSNIHQDIEHLCIDKFREIAE